MSSVYSLASSRFSVPLKVLWHGAASFCEGEGWMNELRFCYFLIIKPREMPRLYYPLSYGGFTAPICALNGVITAPNDDLNHASFGCARKNSGSRLNAERNSRAGYLRLGRYRAANGRQLLTKISLDALALIPLAVSVGKSTNGSADSKTGMFKWRFDPLFPSFRTTAAVQAAVGRQARRLLIFLLVLLNHSCQKSSSMNLKLAATSIGILAISMGSSPAQNTHANVSLQEAQDRVATAEMNLQNVNKGISDRNVFITEREVDVKKKG